MKNYKSKPFLVVASIFLQISLFLSSEAFAAESFYGLEGNAYVGADYVASRAHHRYSESPDVVANPDKAKIKNNGQGYGLNVGYKISKNKFFIAPELFYESLNNDSPDFYDSSTAAGDKLKINDRYGAKLNLGYQFHEKFSAFVNYGRASVGYSQFFPDVSRNYKERRGSRVYGIGVAYKITKNIEARLSYDIQKIETNYNANYDGGSNEADYVRIEATKVGLVYNF